MIVVAAGSGTRLGASVPKGFVSLDGQTLITRAVQTVRQLSEDARLVLVVPADRVREIHELGLSEHSTPVSVVAGGQTRQASVAAGLDALQREIHSGALVDVVLVHDAARPLTPVSVFERVIAEVRAHRCAVLPVLPVVDTIKRVEGDQVRETIERTELRIAQTPQGCEFAALQAAYEQASQEFTDDAALAAAAGIPVRTVDGDALSRKITTREDLEWATAQLARRAADRVGTGIDAHAFAEDPSTELWLGGVHWPGEPGLSGHSDGDVVAHALVDGLLGACGLGDIGALFGTDDPRFAGARGEVFLREARARIEAAGWSLVNASVEVVGNRPRISLRRSEIEHLLSGLLDAPVSVAATTTDGLGLTGEGKGIGAIATVLLSRSRLER